MTHYNMQLFFPIIIPFCIKEFQKVKNSNSSNYRYYKNQNTESTDRKSIALNKTHSSYRVHTQNPTLFKEDDNLCVL